MKFSMMALFLSILIFSCSSTEKNEKENQADLLYSMGTNNLISKNYTLALSNLLQAYEIMPDRSDINNNLGMAYYFKGEKETAKRIVQRALELDPKNSDARSNLASFYMDDKKYEEAKKLYELVLKDLTYNKLSLTYFNLGKIELAQNNFDRAQNYFVKSLKEDENSCASSYHLGLISFKKRDYKTAAKHFKQSYYGPCYNNELPVYYHAIALEKMGDPEGSRLKFREIIERFPRSQYAQKSMRMIDLIDQSAATATPKEFSKNESKPTEELQLDPPEF
jgi:type IV pilus assembly protein PilF